MIKSVKVTNHLGDSILLELAHPERSGLLVYNIEGLGPVKANINVTELATSDGGIYTSSRATTRNIVLTLAMQDPGQMTIEQSRYLAYKYFPVKHEVTLVFETDSRTAQTTGYVESNEPVIFSQEEYTSISIVCPDSYFYGLWNSEMVFSGVQSLFEFPFSNESLTEDQIEMGYILLDTRAILPYSGDAEAGVRIVMHSMEMVEDITIYNVDTRESMFIDTAKISRITGRGFGAGDDIEISTYKGNKYARLLREGKYTNIISCVGRDSDWFYLSNGDNVFQFSARTGEEYLTMTFFYRDTYGGV